MDDGPGTGKTVPSTPRGATSRNRTSRRWCPWCGRPSIFNAVDAMIEGQARGGAATAAKAAPGRGGAALHHQHGGAAVAAGVPGSLLDRAAGVAPGPAFQAGGAPLRGPQDGGTGAAQCLARPETGVTSACWKPTWPSRPEGWTRKTWPWRCWWLTWPPPHPGTGAGVSAGDNGAPGPSLLNSLGRHGIEAGRPVVIVKLLQGWPGADPALADGLVAARQKGALLREVHHVRWSSPQGLQPPVSIVQAGQRLDQRTRCRGGAGP